MRVIKAKDGPIDWAKECNNDTLVTASHNENGELIFILYEKGEPEWEVNDKKFRTLLKETTERYAEAFKRMPKD